MKFTYLISGIATATLLVACGGNPATITKQFYLSVSEGKIDEALKLFDVKQAQAQGFSREKLRAALAARFSRFNSDSCGGLTDVVIVSEEVRGEIANQKIELVCAKGPTTKTNARLMKSDGSWRLVPM